LQQHKTIVIALGGNAILQPGQLGTAPEQLKNIDGTAIQIAQLIKAGYRVVVTHGNGPQVGSLLIQHEAGAKQVPALPLDVCGAQSQGQIGYMLQQCLGRRLAELGENKSVVCVVTQMLVDALDPAFARPTKPVGPFYSEDAAKKRIAETGETWIEDAGRGWRKVVASPDPISIVEREAIRDLVFNDVVVIANGGGGIPVVKSDTYYEGVEAVIDKDLSAQRLAMEVDADILLILTDVEKVALHYKTPEQVNLDTIADLAVWQKQGHFKAGSMGPKVEACRRFIEAGGKVAIITSLNKTLDSLNGNGGTQIIK
jgi:carbamate kinase